MTGPAATPQDRFDVAIIGAGVIGCAIARRFTLEGLRAIVLEKAPDILDGASKGNSAILHTGFDAPPGSLEQACIAAGHAEYLEIHRRLNLPLLRSGALVLAWTPDEEAVLPALMDQARQNGINDVEMLSASALREMEPQLSARLRGGFRVPREHIIDPWSAPHAYLLQALANGATLLRDCEVKAGAFDGRQWRLETTAGPIAAETIINAAGLYGDLVDEQLLGQRMFHIKPRKGQFIVYDKPAAALAGHILLPVPGKTTKGVVVCRTVFGNLLVGPTAEEQDDRRDAVLVPDVLRSLQRHGEDILPALAGMEVTAIYAGLRPATEFKDYQIKAHGERNYISVGGIRSTGLTSALGTARHVFSLYAHFGRSATPLGDPLWPSVANLAEHAVRPWRGNANQGMVCHCERVTRAEIEEVLGGPLAPQSLAGLKRRTRVTMGRCQGFYCSAELAALTKGRLKYPIAGGSHGG